MSRVKQIFTERLHGNMGYLFASPDQAVVANHRIAVSLAFGFSLFRPYGIGYMPYGFSPKLVHGDKIIAIERHSLSGFNGSGVLHPPTIEGDTVITNAVSFPILLTGADCFLGVLHDPWQNVLAVFHSGRKGTFLNIAGKTVEAMQEQFDCSVSDIVAHLSPGICGKCYRLNSLDSFIMENYPGRVKNNSGEIFLDLRGIILRQLLETGIQTMFCVRPEQVECTCCTPGSNGRPKYFSHYGHHKKIPGHETAGRNALLVEMV